LPIVGAAYKRLLPFKFMFRSVAYIQSIWPFFDLKAEIRASLVSKRVDGYKQANQHAKRRDHSFNIVTPITAKHRK
jgi:hypothetical protein